MNLATYINDLLYRYDCVIVPDFGGFVTNKIGAKLNQDTHIFTPPTKQISFNSHLKHNDGLLANYIAAAENISFEKATTAISLCVIKWKNQLQNNQINLNKIGVLSLNEEKQLLFEPDVSNNYLTESFGLAAVTALNITRNKEIVQPIVAATPLLAKENKKETSNFIKYAAAAAILLTFGYAGYTTYNNKQQKQIFANQEKALTKKIQSATFVISNPLPTIELGVKKEVTTSLPYHIVAGAFLVTENAEKKVSQLQAKGFNAKIIGVNKWGLTQVTFDSYKTRFEALQKLKEIKTTISKEAWLLVKDI